MYVVLFILSMLRFVELLARLFLVGGVGVGLHLGPKSAIPLEPWTLEAPPFSRRRCCSRCSLLGVVVAIAGWHGCNGTDIGDRRRSISLPLAWFFVGSTSSQALGHLFQINNGAAAAARRTPPAYDFHRV